MKQPPLHLFRDSGASLYLPFDVAFSQAQARDMKMDQEQEAPSQQPSRGLTQWARSDVSGALGVTLLLQSTVSLLATAIAVLAPAIAKDRGWNLAVVALYAPSVYVGAFGVSFLVPGLLRKLGGMGLALCSVLLAAIGLAGVLSTSVVMALCAALLIGVGYGAMTPASSHILAAGTTPTNIATIMSIKQVGVPLGVMLAAVALPPIAERYGWQSAAAGTIAAGVLLVGTLSPCHKWLNRLEHKPLTSASPFDPVRRLCAIPGMPLMLGATLIYTAVQLCLRSLLATYLVTTLDYSLSAAGLALGVSQFAGMFGQVIWAHLADRFFAPRLVMAALGFLIGTGALATAFLSRSWPTFEIYCVCAVFGFSAGSFVPVILGEVARHSPAGQVGALTSAANMFIISGAFVGPLAFGAISAVAGYRCAFGSLAVCAFLTAVALARGASVHT